MVQILILNGAAGSGKGEVFKFIDEILLDWDVKEYSSIQYIKEVAKESFGWNGVKDTAGRNLLSTMKQAMIKYNNLPTKKIISVIKESIASEIDLIVTDIREPSEIDKLVKWCRENKVICHTCRISNTNKELEAERSCLSLTGDKMYGRYDYSLYIYNNGTLDELKTHIEKVFTDLYINKILIKNTICSPGSNQFEPALKSTMEDICSKCNHGHLIKSLHSMMKVCDYCGQSFFSKKE